MRVPFRAEEVEQEEARSGSGSHRRPVRQVQIDGMLRRGLRLHYLIGR